MFLIIQYSTTKLVIAQSCPTLWDHMYCSLPSSCIHGILQARILEWVAIAFSRRSSWPRDWTRISRIGGRRFNLWASREAPQYHKQTIYAPYNVHQSRKLTYVIGHRNTCSHLWKCAPWWFIYLGLTLLESAASVNTGEDESAAEDKERSSDLDNSILHGARSEKRSGGGKGGWERGEVVFLGPRPALACREQSWAWDRWEDCCLRRSLPLLGSAFPYLARICQLPWFVPAHPWTEKWVFGPNSPVKNSLISSRGCLRFS